MKRVLSLFRPSVVWGGIVSLFFSSAVFAADAGGGGGDVGDVVAAIKTAASPVGTAGFG
ncbi:hypothetical protein LOD59_08465 [Xylella fastidiosa subsp. multiplex]|uniref:hypothetical protein n=1 Tax=Xylella fastidiosa TaxID=2371 RepID=UPI00235E5B4B|nr:hypothetical protein [Xylella fastidiosa]MDD0927660.1 hypothetical protein [Xylella fastidiosa subsp. multiplex]